MTGRTKLPNPRRNGEPITLDWIRSNCRAEVTAVPMTECWTWLGAKSKSKSDVYGTVSFCGETRRAHRVAYELAFEAIPEGMVIDHVCRNPSCVRPDHLCVVTSHENTLRGDLPVRKRGVCGVCGCTEFRTSRKKNRRSDQLRCVECERRFNARRVRAVSKEASIA